MMTIRAVLLSLCLFLISSIGLADNAVRIGVLSFRSLEKTQQQWSALADYLEHEIPGYTFKIIPLYYPDMNAAVLAKQLDFVFTNPEHYVLLRQANGLTAMATLMPLLEGHPVNQFGGVIFTRAQNLNLQSIKHLNGKIIAAPADESFGGFMMQQWELYKQGVKPADFLFTGMPHDNVVDKVLTGKADAGYVRSGVIEALIGEGKIESTALRVINEQHHPDFPQVTSTALYPEWPFASMPETDSALKKLVTLALLNLDDQSHVAKAVHIFGFSPPGDYTKVEAVMLRLNMHSQELKNVNLIDFYYRYRDVIWLALCLLLIILLLSIKLFRIHRHLRHAFLKYHLVADYTSDWEYWIDSAGQVVYMSPTCQQITGYCVRRFKDTPQLLEELVHPEDKTYFLQHWQNHNRAQALGDIEFRILDQQGSIHWIHHLCRPVFDHKNRFLGIRATNRDITGRKKIELDLRLHDAALQACADAIVITNVDAVIQWVNPAFSTLTGYSAAEALGRKPSELVKSGQQNQAFYQLLWQTILSGQSWRGEIVNRKKNGDFYHEQISITPIYGDRQNITHFVAVKQDITERKQIEQQIRQLAFYDPLTQLANRRLLVDRLEYAIASSQRSRQYGALLFLDLDRFKPLNDTYGHDVGDQLLIEVAQRLKAHVRQQDTVSRLGGDEFVVLLVDLSGDREQADLQAKQVAHKIQCALHQPYVLTINSEQASVKTIHYVLTASIGINLFMNNEHSGDKILKQADMAMYEAKHQGRDSVRSFSKSSHEALP